MTRSKKKSVNTRYRIAVDRVADELDPQVAADIEDCYMWLMDQRHFQQAKIQALLNMLSESRGERVTLSSLGLNDSSIVGQTAIEPSVRDALDMPQSSIAMDLARLQFRHSLSTIDSPTKR